MVQSFLAVLFLASGSRPLEITLDPQPGPSFTVVFVGSATRAGAGPFRGRLSLNGSAIEMPLYGLAEPAGDRIRIRATLAYVDVPADWWERLRPDSFDYRLLGEVEGGGTISWSGTLRFDEVSLARSDRAFSGFVRLTSLELTALSVKRSEGRAVLAVANPFTFPVKIAATTYRLRVNGRWIGGGGTRGKTLRSKKTSGVELPFQVDHASFLSAAGAQWAVGADLPAEAAGSLTLRLASVEVSIPFRLPGRMGTDGARSGVFAYPEGATSLSH